MENNNPNQSFNSFFDEIDSSVNKLTKREVKSHFKPWIATGIRNSMKRRDKIYKKYIKVKNDESKSEYENQYKVLRNQIVKLSRDSKNKHFQKYFFHNADNIINTWKGINQIININSKRNKNPSSLIVNNKLISDPIEVANSFNEYLSTVAEKLRSNFYDIGCDFAKYLPNMNEYNFFITPTDSIEVIDIINDLKSNKATGPNSIPNEILHFIKLIIAGPLSKLINLSFEKAIYFDNLKISKAVPIFKDKGNLLERNNYRPISLLSNINKIIEKLMYKRLYSFLSSHKSIYIHQLGFRKRHSTIHALISLTDEIRYALDQNKIACGIFIDLQKAFDTVDHFIWGLRRSNHFIRLERLQNKAIKIINFANFYDPILSLYKESKILKLSDNIKLLNFLYVLDDINHNIPPALENTFQLVANSHDYQTRKSVHHNVAVPNVRTTIYGLKSIKYQSCQEWNVFINHFKDNLLHTKSKSVCKKIICNFFFNTY